MQTKDILKSEQEDLPHNEKREKTFDEKPIYRLGEKASGFHIKGEVQDFNSIRSQCLANDVLFEDPNFPADDSSLFFFSQSNKNLKWLRPKEFCDNPQFFVEGHSRHDVCQGELGDCWLLAAAANLAQDKNLFFRVVPYDQSFQKNYAGVFHFRFWQYGKWVDVVIDDRLPTKRGKLVYMHSSQENEFWSALLEKAYAKLHGSYEALRSGIASEAMEDFTGGVGQVYELDQPPPNLFNILQKAYERTSMMACSLEQPDSNVDSKDETPEGLIWGHSYSITKVQMMDISTPNRSGMIQMIRLRNPWGNETEWNGPWSDQSPEWRFIPEHVKVEIGLTFDMDGEFWMSYTDFVKHFNRVEICYLSPDSLTEEQEKGNKKKWEMIEFDGEWKKGVTAGGCRNFLETFWNNPQYVITLRDPDKDDKDNKCTVIMALMQKNRRSKRSMGMNYLTIGFNIYHLKESDLKQKPQRLEFFKYNAKISSVQYINLREVSAHLRLDPGHYLIVPSTFDPNEEGEFLIRVFSETLNTMEECDEEIGMGDIEDWASSSLSDQLRSTLEQLFIEISGEDMEVDWMELKHILGHFMKDVESDEFSKDICRSMVAMKDVDHSGNLSFEEFKTLLTDIARWKAVFKSHDPENTGKMSMFQLRDALNSAGYHLNNRILNALAYRYRSRDSMIHFDDFIMCAIKMKTMIDIFKERDVDGTNMATFSMDEWIEKTIYS